MDAWLCEYTKKVTKLCIINRWMIWYMNYISVKLVLKKHQWAKQSYLQAWHCLQTLQFRASALYFLIYWMFYSKHPLPWQNAIELVAERTDMPLVILEARVSRSGCCRVNMTPQPLLLAYRQPPFSVCSYDIFSVHVRGETANKLSSVFSYKDTDPILKPYS